MQLMKMNQPLQKLGMTMLACAPSTLAVAADSSTNAVPALAPAAATPPQNWN